MAYVVTGRCLNCKYTDCIDQCPVDCFVEGPDMLYIDPSECINCNLCVALCPVQAIFREDDVPERYKKYIQLNEEKSSKLSKMTRADRREPLSTAKSLAEILKEEEQNP